MKGSRRPITQEDEKHYSRKMKINNNHENGGNIEEPTRQMKRLEAKLRAIKSLIKLMMTVAKTQLNMKNEVKNNLPVHNSPDAKRKSQVKEQHIKRLQHEASLVFLRIPLS